MTNPVVKKLYGLDEFYDEEGCCLTCTRPTKREGCLCYDMKCKQCIFYIRLEWSPEYQKPHCGYGDINVTKHN